MASIQRIVSPLTKEISYRAQVRVKGRSSNSATFPNSTRSSAPHEHFDAHLYAVLEAVGISDFGQKAPAMVKRYSHLIVEHKSKVIEKMIVSKGLRECRSAGVVRVGIS